MADQWIARTKVIIQAAISILVLISCLFVVLSGRYSPADVAWASGLAGVVIGYWLR